MATALVNTETVFETQTVEVPVGERKTVTLVLTEDEAYVVAALVGATGGDVRSDFRKATSAVWRALEEAIGERDRYGYKSIINADGWKQAQAQLEVRPKVKDAV